MYNLTRAAALSLATSTLQAAGMEGARRDAEVLLCHALNIPRTTLIAHSEDKLSSSAIIEFDQLLARRANREPLSYILGSRPFLDFELAVGPGALIPRPETELLVEVVSNYLLSLTTSQANSSAAERRRVIDVGTGSGAVAIGLARRHPDLQVIATDISPQALKIARGNIERLGLQDQVCLVMADLLAIPQPKAESGKTGSGIDQQPSPRDPLFQEQENSWIGHVNAIVSNPPYIPTAVVNGLQPEVAIFEPRLALDGGEDGLEIIRRLIQDARPWLRSGGLLAFEIGAGQSIDALQLLHAANYVECRIYGDLAGIDRVVAGIWNGADAAATLPATETAWS